MRRCAVSACKDVSRYNSVATRYYATTSRALANRVSISQLLRQDGNVEDVEVSGWVRSVRRQKRIAFAALGDGSTLEPLQAVLKPDQAAEISNGTAVRLQGSWQTSQGSKQSHELQVSALKVLGANNAEANPLQPKYQTPEYLRTIPHLRPRVPANALLLKLRSQVIASLTRFFNEEDFLQTHTPIVTSSDCEGAGEVFTIASSGSKHAPDQQSKDDAAAEEHFFRSPKYLTVSAQLHLEALAQAVSKVWTLSPTFRAEESDTPRHLSEFYMLEAEICFVDDMEEVMGLVERMLRAAAADLQSSRIARELLESRQSSQKDEDATGQRSMTPSTLEDRWAGMAAANWPRITYTEAIALLDSAASAGQVTFTFKPSYEEGLQAEHERYIASIVGQGKPVFVTDYPVSQKPFYMAPSTSTTNSKGTASTAACFDLLVPDLCELAGGSMREYRLAELEESMRAKGVVGANLEWYKDLRKYGSVPHGGFGLGFDRLLCYLGGVGNVRDVVAFPRWYGRCDC